MILYWSAERLSTAAEVRSSANALVLEEVELTTNNQKFGSFTRTNSGASYEKILAHYDDISFIISWDMLPLIVRSGADEKKVEKWLLDWEDAKFRWIEGEDANGIPLNEGDPLRVMFGENPGGFRKRINDRADQKEFEYRVVEKEMHKHG